MSDSLWAYVLYPTRILCPWDSLGKNTGVGCHFFLQGIFLTQGLNLSLLASNCFSHLMIFTEWISLNPSLGCSPCTRHCARNGGPWEQSRSLRTRSLHSGGEDTHTEWSHKLDSGNCHHRNVFTHSFITVNCSANDHVVLTWYQALCLERK